MKTMKVQIVKSKKVINLLPKIKRTNSYKQNCEIHFKNRFRERLGYEFTSDTEKRLQNAMVDAKFIGPGDGLNSIWRVNFDGIQIKVVVNNFKNICVTILLPD